MSRKSPKHGLRFILNNDESPSRGAHDKKRLKPPSSESTSPKPITRKDLRKQKKTTPSTVEKGASPVSVNNSVYNRRDIAERAPISSDPTHARASSIGLPSRIFATEIAIEEIDPFTLMNDKTTKAGWSKPASPSQTRRGGLVHSYQRSKSVKTFTCNSCNTSFSQSGMYFILHTSWKYIWSEQN